MHSFSEWLKARNFEEEDVSIAAAAAVTEVQSWKVTSVCSSKSKESCKGKWPG